MPKNSHEIRDPIHVFVRHNNAERKAIDTRPIQRLRHIHQLSLTYLVYPGATHKRFEHSLGVMELADRVYQVVTQNASCEVKNAFTQIADDIERGYWRRVLRMAALMHDIGHPPFSHGAEKQILPKDQSHEDITQKLILSEELQSIWRETKIAPIDVAKLALGPRKFKGFDLSPWETILSDIIVNDAFGVDRMDYLLRDSHHAGVAYGKFDHYRLIDSLRILPDPPLDEQTDNSEHFSLGIERGGIESVEALAFARYFIYSQVYYHPVRRIYDIHLVDFLKEWLPNSQYSLDIEDHLALTDIEVIAAMRQAHKYPSSPAHTHACRIIRREHFKKIYERNPHDIKINSEAGQSVYQALIDNFGPKYFRYDGKLSTEDSLLFPVLMSDGKSYWSSEVSVALTKVPPLSIDYVFADREVAEKAKKWIAANRQEIIKPVGEDNDG